MRHSRCERSRGVIRDHGEPATRRRARRRDRAVDVHRGRLRDLDEDLLGRRVDGGEGLAVLRVHPLAVDEQLLGRGEERADGGQEGGVSCDMVAFQETGGVDGMLLDDRDLRPVEGERDGDDDDRAVEDLLVGRRRRRRSTGPTRSSVTTSAPASVRHRLPWPPVIAVPPTTIAATAGSSRMSASVGPPLKLRATSMHRREPGAGAGDAERPDLDGVDRHAGQPGRRTRSSRWP